jgi:hypothetical protein
MPKYNAVVYVTVTCRVEVEARSLSQAERWIKEMGGNDLIEHGAEDEEIEIVDICRSRPPKAATAGPEA